MMNTHLSIRAICAAALLITTAAHAADKKEATFGGGKGAGAFLTKDQLRDCMTRQTQVKQVQADLLATQTKLNGDKVEIAKRGEALKAQLETLDRSNLEAVTAFNDQSGARDKMIDEYQDQATKFNARVEAAKTERDGYSKACENRRYFEDDEAAIRKGTK